MSTKSRRARLVLIEVDQTCSPEDSRYEVANMKPGVGQLEVFPTVWGHWAGGPGDSKADLRWLDGKLSVFFDKHGAGTLER